MKAVSVSDTINGVLLLVGGLMIPILGLIKLGEGSIFNGLEILVIENPHKMNAIVASTSDAPFETLFTGMFLVNLFYWCTNQQIVQRAFAAKNLKEGQIGTLLAGFIKMFVILGIIAFHLYSDKITHQDLDYSVLVSQVLPLVGFFGAVLFGAVLSSFNSALNSASTMFCLIYISLCLILK